MEKYKPRTESLAKYSAELGEKTMWQCSSIKIKNENRKPLLADDPRLLRASTVRLKLQPGPGTWRRMAQEGERHFYWHLAIG